jgi:hypothetical protein
MRHFRAHLRVVADAYVYGGAGVDHCLKPIDSHRSARRDGPGKDAHRVLINRSRVLADHDEALGSAGGTALYCRIAHGHVGIMWQRLGESSSGQFMSWDVML